LVDCAVCQGKLCRSHGELNGARHHPDRLALLLRHEVFLDVEIGHFTGDAHRQPGDVHVANGPNATAAFPQGAPERTDVGTDRTDDAQARDYHPTGGCRHGYQRPEGLCPPAALLTSQNWSVRTIWRSFQPSSSLFVLGRLRQLT